MKFCIFAATLLVSLIVSTTAVPAYKRMAYYQQQPAAYYIQARSGPQRMMYVQQYPVTHARSTAISTGDAVSAGSYLKDCVHPEDAASVEQQPGSVEQQAAAASAVNDAGAGGYPAAGGQASNEFEGTFADNGYEGGVSVAAGAAAPEVPQEYEVPEAPAVENQVLEDDSVAPSAVGPESVPAASDDEAKVPREYNFDKPADDVPEPAVSSVDSTVAEEALPAIPAVPEVPEVPSANPEQAPEAPVADADAGDAAPAPAAPAVVPATIPVAVAPPKRYLPPRKKVTVKLDEQSEAASDDDEQDVDTYRPARIPNARRPVKGNASASPAKAAKAPLPAGTYFPISFGGTSGGAIAIANSFSTGEGGSATSHAIAYGSPEAARAKSNPSRRH